MLDCCKRSKDSNLRSPMACRNHSTLRSNSCRQRQCQGIPLMLYMGQACQGSSQLGHSRPCQGMWCMLRRPMVGKALSEEGTGSCARACTSSTFVVSFGT